ncbi:PhzF family phenazine biosynthesis isomerase [Rhodococcus sp. IEGM 1381]|uniref:PhzF family phenazine biosynthesis protein n=1 Tax=Rhodococcus sp. IEGM 1381 TaxID=3047085 RepID=UPI0024B67C9C|nr:PhzF family phenazine biosynthesis isomerase [Rhodococcus sp. IEGM 1381]MDI9896051.1 PhzF family phenazine biosynthesis isomerase [Rhodococcus sp. IEGM 1381]
MSPIDIQRWTAFSSEPSGGNPAGVVLDARGLDDIEMLRIAADVGYAETAFVTPGDGDGSRAIRYFSPVAEVPFCGHATVAAAAAISATEGVGSISFATPVGDIEIETSIGSDGAPLVSFTSVEPRTGPLSSTALADVLGALGLTADHLHPIYVPAEAFGGNWHPLVVLNDRSVFDGFTPDLGRARAVLDEHGWPATIIVLWPQGTEQWHARNVFPVGTITEDPATGAAAAATGGYLRGSHVVQPPASIVIHQGSHVGRPSKLLVDIPPSGGIIVSGSAARIA